MIVACGVSDVNPRRCLPRPHPRNYVREGGKGKSTCAKGCYLCVAVSVGFHSFCGGWGGVGGVDYATAILTVRKLESLIGIVHLSRL
jgi:hypothetical protein